MLDVLVVVADKSSWRTIFSSVGIAIEVIARRVCTLLIVDCDLPVCGCQVGALGGAVLGLRVHGIVA